MKNNDQNQNFNIEELEKIKVELEACQKTNKDYLDGWKRERADFINYKKDEQKRVGEIIKFANEKLILDVLVILDNFELAEKSLPDNLKSDEWVKGVLQIKQSIVDLLKKENLKVIESVGLKFNPQFHEAAEEIEVEGKESGEIIEELRRGYMLNSKVIRPARVRVVK